jgi:hypothetical protein
LGAGAEGAKGTSGDFEGAVPCGWSSNSKKNICFTNQDVFISKNAVLFSKNVVFFCKNVFFLYE